MNIKVLSLSLWFPSSITHIYSSLFFRTALKKAHLLDLIYSEIEAAAVVRSVYIVSDREGPYALRLFILLAKVRNSFIPNTLKNSSLRTGHKKIMQVHKCALLSHTNLYGGLRLIGVPSWS